VSTSKRVAVLMGGMSSEHEISLKSGAGVIGALEGSGYTALPITIDPGGAWIFGKDSPRSIHEALAHLGEIAPDCVFIALHGAFGEDGRMQGLLDLLGLPYTGSGCAASALAMDKVRCKAVVEDLDVPAASHLAFSRDVWRENQEDIAETVEDGLNYPCVVKTPRGGSSVGVEIVQNADALNAAVKRCFAHDDEVMVEEYIDGRELTCAVLDVTPGESCRALPVTEIRPKDTDFFDYEAKYTPGASDEITPADLDPEITAQIQHFSCLVHEGAGCEGWSRSDFMLEDDGPVWIEVNTVPGLTETSLYPQACAAAGISYEEMIAAFVEAAIAKRQA
jgi:D-alanine-D-alanine ligase